MRRIVLFPSASYQQNRHEYIQIVLTPKNTLSTLVVLPARYGPGFRKCTTAHLYHLHLSAVSAHPQHLHYQTQGSCPADTATPPDSDCVGFGWIPNSGSDWQEYYHKEFKGFGTVLTTSSAGNLSVEKYASTWGWDSPESDSRNYLAGQLL